MSAELERVRQSSQLEKAAALKEVRAKDAALEDCRKALRDERAGRARAEERATVLEQDCKARGEAAGELAGFREKLRDANVARTELEKKVSGSGGRGVGR